MKITDYVRGIVTTLFPDAQFIEAHINDALQGDWEANLQLDCEEYDCAIVFKNLGTFGGNLSRSQYIRYENYTLAIELLEMQREFDDTDEYIDDNILTNLEQKAYQILSAITKSEEYQCVQPQVENQEYNITTFRDKHDTINAGVELILPVRLNLGQDLCFD